MTSRDAQIDKLKKLTVLWADAQPKVAGFVGAFIHNFSDAQDIVQEVFKYFFLKFPGFELRSSVTTFLYPVVRNKTVDCFRKLRRQAEVPAEAVPEQSSPPSPEMVELSILDLIAELPEFQREVILLRFVNGLSLKEVSDRLGVPEGTVKSRLHNGLKVLRKLFSIFFLFP